MSLELPILEALYAIQKLVEPLPEPEEITITTDPDYAGGMQVSVVFYVLKEHKDQWKEAILKIEGGTPDILWEVF